MAPIAPKYCAIGTVLRVPMDTLGLVYSPDTHQDNLRRTLEWWLNNGDKPTINSPVTWDNIISIIEGPVIQNYEVARRMRQSIAKGTTKQETRSMNQQETRSMNQQETRSMNQQETRSMNQQETRSMNQQETRSMNQQETRSINQQETSIIIIKIHSPDCIIIIDPQTSNPHTGTQILRVLPSLQEQTLFCNTSSKIFCIMWFLTFCILIWCF